MTSNCDLYFRKFELIMENQEIVPNNYSKRFIYSVTLNNKNDIQHFKKWDFNFQPK